MGSNGPKRMAVRRPVSTNICCRDQCPTYERWLIGSPGPDWARPSRWTRQAVADLGRRCRIRVRPWWARILIIRDCRIWATGGNEKRRQHYRHQRLQRTHKCPTDTSKQSVQMIIRSRFREATLSTGCQRRRPVEPCGGTRISYCAQVGIRLQHGKGVPPNLPGKECSWQEKHHLDADCTFPGGTPVQTIAMSANVGSRQPWGRT